jgi:hypothetical protein
MSRRRKPQFANKAEKEKHEARLVKRRAKYHDWKTKQLAMQAAEGEADFEELIEAEKQRKETFFQTKGRQGGSKSPRVMDAARDDLARAFDLMGGVPALVVWGRKNPTDFYRIWAKLIPTNVQSQSQSMPLEDLLEKLATRENQPVAQAAREIGEELLEKGRRAAEEEDIRALSKLEIN